MLNCKESGAISASQTKDTHDWWVDKVRRTGGRQRAPDVAQCLGWRDFACGEGYTRLRKEAAAV